MLLVCRPRLLEVCCEYNSIYCDPICCGHPAVVSVLLLLVAYCTVHKAACPLGFKLLSDSDPPQAYVGACICCSHSVTVTAATGVTQCGVSN